MEDDLADSENSDKSAATLPTSSQRPGFHAHYDQVNFSRLSISLTPVTPRDFGKECFAVNCDGNEWNISRTHFQIQGFDNQLHACLFTRKFSRLPVLRPELFEVSEYRSKEERRRRREAVRLLLEAYMADLSDLLAEDICRLGCGSLLQFFQMNNNGEFVGDTTSPMSRRSVTHSDVSPTDYGSVWCQNGSYFDKIRRTFRTESTKHGKVFGVDLIKHTARHGEKVPCVVVECIEYLEQNLARGLYRISSVSSQINALKNLYNNKKGVSFNFQEASADSYSVSCLLKLYFRLLPEKLLQDLPETSTFSKATEQQVMAAREIVHRLPLAHIRTAAFLMKHLALVAEKCSQTNMDSANLALVWSPNLFRIKSTREQIDNMSSQNVFVETLIRWHKDIFYNTVLTAEHKILFNKQSNGTLSVATDSDAEELKCQKSSRFLSPTTDCQRVRSEEPPSSSFMNQFKHNLRMIGTNMKLSLRNLVRIRSPSSSSADSVQYFGPSSLGRMHMSTVSLFAPRSDHYFDSKNSFEDFKAPPRPSKSPDAPKAEFDSFSIDSFRFDASRYDNLEESRIRSPLSL